MKRIFISSVQKELAVERAAIRDYVQRDPLLRQCFEIFLFEDMPATDRRADRLYLDEVSRCDIYVGLLGKEYGSEDQQGISPTERELQRATELGKTRLIYVKGKDDLTRQPKVRALLKHLGPQLVRRRFDAVDQLCEQLQGSLVEYLMRTGVIQTLPFDEQSCTGATLADLDHVAMRRFVKDARRTRQLPLPEQAESETLLSHLNLLRDGLLTRAAVLLFGKQPQQFVAGAEIRCMRFHGTEIQRPAPFYRVFGGNLFTQIDQAVDFVLSKIDISVGTRASSTQAPTRIELPPEVIREAIVNAVAHRDYTHQGAIQVSVFADRIEIWNPGELLAPLTLEQLRKPHRSLTRNARIAEALYLAGYIEKYGTGTLMMIRESVEHALPEPEFDQPSGEFSVTLWRDWLTEQMVIDFSLNERQRNVVPHLKVARRITNAEYRQLTGSPERTASRDLDEMVTKGLLRKSAKTGRGVTYSLVLEAAKNRPNPPLPKPAKNPPNRPRVARAKTGSVAKSRRTAVKDKKGVSKR